MGGRGAASQALAPELCPAAAMMRLAGRSSGWPVAGVGCTRRLPSVGERLVRRWRNVTVHGSDVMVGRRCSFGMSVGLARRRQVFGWDKLVPQVIDGKAVGREKWRPCLRTPSRRHSKHDRPRGIEAWPQGPSRADPSIVCTRTALRSRPPSIPRERGRPV